MHDVVLMRSRDGIRNLRRSREMAVSGLMPVTVVTGARLTRDVEVFAEMGRVRAYRRV